MRRVYKDIGTFRSSYFHKTNETSLCHTAAFLAASQEMVISLIMANSKRGQAYAEMTLVSWSMTHRAACSNEQAAASWPHFSSFVQGAEYVHPGRDVWTGFA